MKGENIGIEMGKNLEDGKNERKRIVNKREKMDEEKGKINKIFKGWN